jgi:vacuolar-type H+-ATPase subunit E/Vma4
MGYRELLQALEEEVGRQIRERGAEASRQHAQLLETARRELSAAHDAALEAERRRLAEESGRTLSRVRLEQDRAVLGEMRQQLAALRSATDARLSTMNDAELVTRLADEIVPELGDGELLFRVKEGYRPRLESHLRQKYPGLLARSTIEESPQIRGGVEVSIAGRERFDNTLASRLNTAWEQLEPEIAGRLFGTGAAAEPGATGPDGPSRKVARGSR